MFVWGFTLGFFFFLIFEFYIYKKNQRHLQEIKLLENMEKVRMKDLLLTFSAWQLENCKMLEFTM